MIRNFRYKPPVYFLIIGICGLAAFITTILDLMFDTPLKGFEIGQMWMHIWELVFYLLMGLLLTINYIKKYQSGKIVLSDDYIELPQFFGKPDKVKLLEIRYVIAEEDGLVKISASSGFYRFNKRFMQSDEFEELKNGLQHIAQANISGAVS